MPKRLTVSLFGAVLLLCAFSVPVVYAQVQNCENDTQCGNGVFCDGIETCMWSGSEGASICVPGSNPCQASETCDEASDTCAAAAGCKDDADCEDGDTPYCNNDTLSCVECITDGDCDMSAIGPYCDDESLSCVECIEDADCSDNETCSEGSCEPSVAACELKIRPKKVRIGKMYRLMERKFKIKGGEDFDPYAEIVFGFLQPYIKKTMVTKKGKLKVWVITPTGTRLFKGPLEIRVGDCVGEVLFK